MFFSFIIKENRILKGECFMKKFFSGMLIGSTVTCIAVAGVATIIKKSIIDPIEEKEEMIEENRKKAMRKRIAH